MRLILSLNRLLSIIVISFTFSFSASGLNSALLPNNINYSFIVSMENPNTHYFQVEMTCTNQQGMYIDFKMPVWTPGYYYVQNLSKNVVGFKARNVEGQNLSFLKTSKNTWRVNTNEEKTVIISYEVYASELAVINSYLDASQAFISPTGIFMFPDGDIQEPSLVTFKLYKNWKRISTGLEKVVDKPNTYFASNFDVLFDCPTLLGTHNEIEFSVKGISHTLAFSEKDTLDKNVFINDLKKIIESATDLMGDIPYSHYSFLTIASPGGGLEHSNSCVLSCNGSVADTTDLKAYHKWLAFVTHEYFHLYNIKRIRPVALGPFNYDKECYTNLLWFSEGGTVYYENIILNKAGIFNRNECLKNFSESISNYENRPGHLIESASSSSFDAWIHFFESPGDARNNTISYYDKGCALTLLLDLKIREASQNKQSLDDVMRGLYNKYFKELKRGFTDEEFQSMCEQKAGISLHEIFTYVGTVAPINYPKYFELTGLSIDTTALVVEGEVQFGAMVHSDEQRCWLSNVERNSPAWNAGLGNDIELVKIEGHKATSKIYDKIIKLKKPAETLELLTSVGGVTSEVSVVLAQKMRKVYKIEELKKVSDQEKMRLEAWLK